MAEQNRRASAGKRVLDLLFGGLLLIVATPVVAMVGVLVGAALGRPVFFRQMRPGLDGKPFTLFKFRTMQPAAEGMDTSDEARITRLGGFLRRSSLDELPELWNVLRGDMSLVGPRPLLMEYTDRYSARQARRLEVKPGLTGLAQVSGRNALSWDDKFELDVFYVDNWSLRLDLKILAKTVWHVITGRGINAPGHATMPKFRGGRDD